VHLHIIYVYGIALEPLFANEETSLIYQGVLALY